MRPVIYVTSSQVLEGVHTHNTILCLGRERACIQLICITSSQVLEGVHIQYHTLSPNLGSGEGKDTRLVIYITSGHCLCTHTIPYFQPKSGFWGGKGHAFSNIHHFQSLPGRGTHMIPQASPNVDSAEGRGPQAVIYITSSHHLEEVHTQNQSSSLNLGSGEGQGTHTILFFQSPPGFNKVKDMHTHNSSTSQDLGSVTVKDKQFFLSRSWF